MCAAAASMRGYLLNPLLLAPVMASTYRTALRTDRRTTRVHLFATAAALTIALAAAQSVRTGAPVRAESSRASDPARERRRNSPGNHRALQALNSM